VGEGIELVASMSAGEPGPEGQYPGGTFHRAVADRLAGYAEILKHTVSRMSGFRLSSTRLPHGKGVMSDQLPGTTGHALLEQIRLEVEPLTRKITAHPYLEALEQHRVPEDALRPLATQQYLIVTNGIRNMALTVSRFGHLPSRKVLNDFLQAEFAVHAAVQQFDQAIGLGDQDLQQARPLPGALMFSYYETFVCLYASDADLITAFFFDAQVWIRNARRVSQALQTRYHLSPEAVTFFEMYANYQASEETVVPCLDAALERGVPADQIRESTRLLLAYELSFWDAMAEAAGIA
jgi:thiaminase